MTDENKAEDQLPEDMPPETVDTADNVHELKPAEDRTAELEKKVAEANDRALRALAEADNTRKRLEKERQDTAKFAVSSFARDLLSVADNLKRAINAITPEQRETNTELKNIAIGVEATERELTGIFERNGIRKVDPIGQTFDPNFHEVIFEAEIPGKSAGTVIQVVEVGYTIHERLLRPARVGVAKGGEGVSGSGGNIDTEA